MPKINSPLESLFILVFVQRQQADLLATRALVASALADEEKKEAIEAFEKYCEKMFPFWSRAGDTKDDEQRKALLEMVKHPIKIKMAEVYKAQAKALRRSHARSPSAAKTGQARRPAGIPDRFRTKQK